MGAVIAYIVYFGLTFNTRYNEYLAQKDYCASLGLIISSNKTTTDIQSDEFHKMVQDIVDCAVFKSTDIFFPISLLFHPIVKK